MGSCGPRLLLVWLPQPLQHLSLQERIANALLELHVPRCLDRDQRQRGHQAADFAEALAQQASPTAFALRVVLRVVAVV